MRLWRSAGTAEFAKNSVRTRNSIISKRHNARALWLRYIYKLVLSKLFCIICYLDNIAQLIVLLQQKYGKVRASLEPMPGESADSSFHPRKRIIISVTGNPAVLNQDPKKTPRLLPLSRNSLEVLNAERGKNKRSPKGSIGIRTRGLSHLASCFQPEARSTRSDNHTTRPLSRLNLCAEKVRFQAILEAI